MKNLILTLVFALAFLGCDRNSGENEYNPQLPPITQTGANTFGAIINGKVMVPRNGTSDFLPGNSAYPVHYRKSNNYEQIQGGDAKTKRGYIYVYIQNDNNVYPIITGNYAFGDSNGSTESTFSNGVMMTSYLNGKKYLSIANTGSINITKSDLNIISGTFSCKLKNKDNPNDIIEITNGRFDFDKNTINTTNFP